MNHFVLTLCHYGIEKFGIKKEKLFKWDRIIFYYFLIALLSFSAGRHHCTSDKIYETQSYLNFNLFESHITGFNKTKSSYMIKVVKSKTFVNPWCKPNIGIGYWKGFQSFLKWNEIRIKKRCHTKVVVKVNINVKPLKDPFGKLQEK